MAQETQESSTGDGKTETTTKKKTNRKRSEKKAGKKIKFSATNILESLPTPIIKLDIPNPLLPKEKEEKEENDKRNQSDVVSSCQQYPRSYIKNAFTSNQMSKSPRWKMSRSDTKFCRKCNRYTRQNRRRKNKATRKMNQLVGKREENGQILYLLFSMV